MTIEEYEKLLKAVEEYKKLVSARKKILTHGDLGLGGGNIMVDDGSNICGLVDFENIGFNLPELELKKYKDDADIFKSATEEYHKLSGVWANDKRVFLVLEIIIMVVHLERFYCLGDDVIKMRVGIIKNLLAQYIA